MSGSGEEQGDDGEGQHQGRELRGYVSGEHNQGGYPPPLAQRQTSFLLRGRGVGVQGGAAGG